MQRTYRAVVRGDRIEWIDPPPERRRAIPVHIILQGNISDASDARGDAMAKALTDLADMGGLSFIPDPVAWQRDLRKERPLPERESNDNR